MVDPHQNLIDNEYSSAKSSEPQADLTQMNNSDIFKYPDQHLQPASVVINVVSDANDLDHENRQNDMMCGVSAQNHTTSTIQSNKDNNSEDANASLVLHNGENSVLISNNISRDIKPIKVNANRVCVVLDKKPTRESNDSHNKQTLSTTINSADTKTQGYFAAIQPNANIVLEHNNQIDTTVSILTNKMDSRKVEPLRININRDPIKTKIKLGTSDDRQSLSPKSSSSSTAGIDECDDASEMLHENQQSYPKITIKPIIKPSTESEHHHNNSALSHIPSSSQEAIPKLKIKMVDSNNSNSSQTPISTHLTASHSDDISGHYQTHLLSEPSPSVPKLVTVRSSTTNLSIDSNSYYENNCSASNEVVPKLTIKLDNHGQNSAAGESPRSLVSAAGVKLTLKPIAEPPLPRFTITNAFNDTAKVIMLNNSEQTDESSDELPSQPPSSQPSPDDKASSRNEYATHAITSTSSSYSGPNAEDNLSTCSSGSSSSYSSNSSAANTSNDIKLIIKATSTGGCIVSPTSSIARNSPSSVKLANNLKVSSSKSSIAEQSKLNIITSNIVTSSTANLCESIPKLNIKFSGTDYPQVIHNDTEHKDTQNEGGRTASPLPKLTIRMANSHDDNIVIPKVTIKPVVNPNENSDSTNTGAQLVTPKIILKSIPKPIEKPLEIVTGGQGSPFRNAENESQQSPRIILKINKNSSSQKKESSTLTSTTIIADDSVMRSDSPQQTKHNELKRTNLELDIHSKKQKLGNDVVQLLSSDSDTEEIAEQQTTNNNHNELSQNQANVKKDPIEAATSMTTLPFDTNSGLRKILSQPQMKIQPQPLQNFLQTLPPFKSISDSGSKVNDVIDLCHDSNDQVINAPLEEESTSYDVTEATNQGSENTDECKTSLSKNCNVEEMKKTSYSWQYFYSKSEKEQTEPIHPLLQHNIERANVLAAMMEAANNSEISTNGSNNNTTRKVGFDQTTNSKNLLIENEGSSSDCIVIEDTASEPFPSEYASADNSIEQNGRKKDSVDRDSGVDISNSVKSVNEEEPTPVAKRPRGRPRKGTTPSVTTKKPAKVPGSKRKLAGAQVYEKNSHNAKPDSDYILADEALSSTNPSKEYVDDVSTEFQTKSQIKDMTDSTQSSDLSIPCTIKISPTTAPVAVEISENIINELHQSNMSAENETTQIDLDIIMSPTELITTPIPGNSTMNKTISLTSPTTPSVPKERKRRIIIDDDDESPTFNPLRSNKKIRGKNRRRQNSLMLKKRKIQVLSQSDKTNENVVFTSPEGIELRKVKDVVKDTSTVALQVFEEDTRMSADSLFTSPTIRNTEFLQNDESQSSLHSSTSVTVENSTKKIRSKIEVADPEGRTEFTVDMIAEYDWPPPKGCCPSRNRDTYMIQEQIAEYLGVKSFKRKYPDLPRRMVEMEERNYLMEKSLVSEKMCDLGLTAVFASDVLDIMNNDFFEKYEEYRRYLREKQIRDLTARQKQLQAGTLGKSLSARENAMRAASMWNSDFNRSRIDNRRECLDLQNFVIQIPEVYRNRPNRPVTKPSNYPVALVPGQFQEFYRKFSPAELLCYPINTVLADPYQLDRRLREYYIKVHRSRYVSDDESGNDSDSSCSSDSNSNDSDTSDDSSSSSDESTDDEANVKEEVEVKVGINKPSNDNKKFIPKVNKTERDKCQVCNGSVRNNQQNKPELFVNCTNCKGNAHPTCLKMSARMVRRVNEYAWQCKKCKSCIKCRRDDNEDKMLFCDQCDRTYHIYCIGLRKIPNGKWHCAVCTVCTLCGARRPEGHNNPNLTQQQKQKLLAVAKWTHEYQDNPVTKESEHVSMLCTSCMAIKHSAAKNVYFN